MACCTFIAESLLTSPAVTKNGIVRLGAPPALNLEQVTSDKKITDEEILKILDKPLSKPSNNKPKSKKKPAAKTNGEAADKTEAASEVKA